MTNQHTFELGMALAKILRYNEELAYQANYGLDNAIWGMDQKMSKRMLNIESFERGIDCKIWLLKNVPDIKHLHTFGIKHLSKTLEPCEHYYFRYKDKTLRYYCN